MTEPKTFTTDEFKNKINETIRLAKEIKDSSSAKNPKIIQLVKLQSEKVLKLLTKLNAGNDDGRGGRVFNFERPGLMDSERMNWINEINDSLIDKTVYYMDRAKNVTEGKGELIQVKIDASKANNAKIKINDFNGGHPGSGTPVSGIKRKHPNSDTSARPRKTIFLTQSNVIRPQAAYNLNADNNYSTPFIPKLTKKPNALVSFEESLSPVAIEAAEVPAGVNVSFPTHYYPHPYKAELERFEVPLQFLEQPKPGDAEDEPKLPGGPDSKPFHLISKRDQLIELVDKLKKAPEIAIDLEHHSFRTYQGITCLMQLSTDEEDYVVDVFPLWTDMELLNEVFTDPKILKIFHGSDFDIIWLQRDLGLYVVNMFDTGLAARQLCFPHFSLSYLISRYCDVELDKRFQLADWRLRPLTEEMLLYARLDTHYLLYVYRRIKRDLLANSDESANLLRAVCERSKDLCLKRYEKSLPKANDHILLTWKHNLRFDSRQLAALKSLYQWRDTIARNLDESVGYVLPSTLMLKIAEVLPREQQGILACCSPIPPLVRQYINEIHRLVVEARSKTAAALGDTKDMKFDRVRRVAETSIDLSNDRLIDDYQQGQQEPKSKEDEAKNRSAGEHARQEYVPSLVWDNSKGAFLVNQDKRREPSMATMFETVKATTRKIERLQDKMADMFVANMARVIRDEIGQKQACNKVDNLFVDYISPYQRYQKALEDKDKLKDQEEEEEEEEAEKAK